MTLDTIHLTSADMMYIFYLSISSCFDQAMQMHQQHSTQLEVLRAAKLAEAINQKATSLFGRGNLILLGQPWITLFDMI